MKERPTNGQVIIVFTEHPILGILLIPYIAERLNDGTLQLVEQAFHASPEAMSIMSKAERQAIDIASYYTEKYLMGLYSREKQYHAFYISYPKIRNELKIIFARLSKRSCWRCWR